MALLLIWLMGPGIPSPAHAEATVVEEILDILRDKHDNSAAQYQAPRARAQCAAPLNADHAAADAVRAAQAAAPPPAAPANGLQAFWKNGLRFTSADKAFDVRLGARIQNDWAVLAPDDDLEDLLPDQAGKGTGTEFRRARLKLEGTVYERIGFKGEYEFAGGDAALRDVYLELMDLPAVGLVRVGHFKEPMSLEQMTSDAYTTFVERSVLDAFAPGRETGFLLTNHALEQRLSWAVGAFRDTDSASGDGFSSDPLYDVTGRITGLPWFEEDGSKLLHVGVSLTQKFRDGADVRLSQRPEAHLAPNFVDTGNFAADHIQIVNPEIALVLGPLSLQAEYSQAFVDSGNNDVGDPRFHAFYVQGSYFLTGEHRPYKPASGVFDRVVPLHNLDSSGGIGAWELAARFSRIDLDSEGISGGTLTSGTLGINWYLNPVVRTTFNYGLGRLEGEGWTNQFQTRFQVDF
jgi:phosphate-selective porin OprO/OprP